MEVLHSSTAQEKPLRQGAENASQTRVRSPCALLLLAAACGHASPSRASARLLPDGGVSAPSSDPVQAAEELSVETHALLRTEGNLLWNRWTTGAGAMPASALGEHPWLARRESLELVSAAASKKPDSKPLMLLKQRLATLIVSREAGGEIDALERARAQLSFSIEGDGAQERSERDIDRLLTEEPSAQKRAALALAEAKAALPLAPLVLARDAAVEKAIAILNLGSWSALEESAHGIGLAELAALAERTLVATEAIGAKAVSTTSVRNIGVPADRLRRSDLARLVRSALADGQFTAGRAWPSAKEVFTRIGAEPPPAALRIDAEPSPSKGARPLALLIDPPADVRLSLRPAGGFEEQRATFHEGARALGGTLAAPRPWELAQLGDGSAAEGAAHLFEELAGDPAWLRETTQLRGEPLDDLVHTQAVRRLLSARRSAALVLFEIQRRQGARTAEAQAALYRGLVQRATFAVLSDADVGRWALEADSFIRGAVPLLGAVLGAQLEARKTADGAPWWKSPETGKVLRKLWAGGRSLTAMEAARELGLVSLDPAALASVAAAQLAYTAPEAPLPTPKPDYKYMQGDKKRRRYRKKK
jgi:hypothetical protein